MAYAKPLSKELRKTKIIWKGEKKKKKRSNHIELKISNQQEFQVLLDRKMRYQIERQVLSIMLVDKNSFVRKTKDLSNQQL